LAKPDAEVGVRAVRGLVWAQCGMQCLGGSLGCLGSGTRVRRMRHPVGECGLRLGLRRSGGCFPLLHRLRLRTRLWLDWNKGLQDEDCWAHLLTSYRVLYRLALLLALFFGEQLGAGYSYSEGLGSGAGCTFSGSSSPVDFECRRSCTSREVRLRGKD
jgi:hypothetical protein